MPPRKKPDPKEAASKKSAASTKKSADSAKKKAAPAKPRPKAAAPETAVTNGKTRRAAAPDAAPKSERGGETSPKRGTAGKNLVIVESPAKAKTIEKYLGPNFRVLASYGHVRDLPPKGKLKGEEVVGVNIAGGWKPRYVVVDRGEKGGGRNRRSAEDILAELKREADKAGMVYLATDPDREGESIAWHICEALNLDPKRTQRISFNEITRTAVQRAIANPTTINDQLVQAQEARRVLDRVVGYPLSNLLGKKVTRGLSAGRVQSVAVKLIVDREREIEAFKSEEYWKIIALLAPQGTVPFTADPANAKIYAKKRGEHLKAKAQEATDAAADAEDAEETSKEKEQAPKIPPGTFQAELSRWEGKEFAASTEQQADAIYAILNTSAYKVTKVEQKDENRRAPAPFTTSTLQQSANQRLRLPARITMNLAQELYQGVQMGSEGSVALITYMRTDSTRVSDDALKMVRSHIDASFGPKYLPDKPNVYKSGKSAQEAHEAIRPTDLAYTPQRVQPYLSPDQHRLYTLIFNQFVASQMTPAIVAVTSVEVEAGPGLLKAGGSIEKFDGWRRVLPPAKQEDKILPPLADKQALDKLDLTASQHFTQPPPRYNEASLVKMLEKEGIGRPSTYATIISTIQSRGYVKQEQRRFHATEVGMVVTDLLVKHFPDVINLKFTSHIEEELDEIENGKMAYQAVLDEFWAPFSKDLAEAETKMEKQKGVETGEPCPRCGKPLVEQYSKKTGRKFVGCSGWKEGCSYIKPGEGEAERPAPVVTEHKCPTCGQPMIQKVGRYGTFLACSGAPECKTTMNIGPDGKPVLASKSTEHKCEKCGKPMVLKEWKGRYFLGCSGYPQCRSSMDADKDGNPVKPVETGVACEKCGSPMRVKRGFRGPFLSCSGYPKCRNAKPIPAELKEKLKDALPPAPDKKKTPDILVDAPCPICGSKMKLCWARGRAFLGCSTWSKTKCKGTLPIDPETVEALQKQAALAAAATEE